MKIIETYLEDEGGVTIVSVSACMSPQTCLNQATHHITYLVVSTGSEQWNN